jgi:hypothetical protein
LGEFLGKGAAGHVVKGILKPNGKYIAIKVEFIVFLDNNMDVRVSIYMTKRRDINS